MYYEFVNTFFKYYGFFSFFLLNLYWRILMNTRVKQLRKYLGLTQEQFANAIGIKGGSLSMIEIGKSVVTEQNLKLICSTYNVSENWLKTGEGDMFNPSLPGDTKELLKIYDALYMVNKRLILDHARYLLGTQVAQQDESLKTIPKTPLLPEKASPSLENEPEPEFSSKKLA
jgi:transcriptional regulator with XRE-family HTH domain